MDKRPAIDAGSVCAAVARAIALKRTQENLALACGVSQAAISRVRKAGRLSPQLAIAIHHATAGAVPGSALRPDLWRRPEDVPVEITWPPDEPEEDDAAEPWDRLELMRMDRAFCAAMRRAIACGSEKPRGPVATPTAVRVVRRFDPVPRRSGASSPAESCVDLGDPDPIW
jgi:DNA-binding transcriptional regulator YdaS (Cro superfamily)